MHSQRSVSVSFRYSVGQSGVVVSYDGASDMMEVLSNALDDGTMLKFVDDVSISARDGKVYFSSASEQPVSWISGPDEFGSEGYYDTMLASKMNLAHGAPTGRLVVYDPASRT